MQHILVLGAGKSATILIDHLLQSSAIQDLFIHVADGQLAVAEAKTGGHPRAAAYAINPENKEALRSLISGADLVISMLPPTFHSAVAKECLALQKHFLNASYLTPEISSMDTDAENLGLTFLCEMGLDPGIDHMSAMEMIHRIQDEGGRITSFRSHCGGLISPESDTNPWHYKISWNPRNIVMAGSDGARYLSNGEEIFIPYPDLFRPEQTINVPAYGIWAWYANRDSIAYISKYGLNGVKNFVRTTVRHPHFCFGWRKIVELGLTSKDGSVDTTGISTRSFFEKHFELYGDHLPIDDLTRSLFNYLGFYSDEPLPSGQHSPADILQWILENKLALLPQDKDMIIMLHEIEYELDGQLQRSSAHLVVKGEDQQHTAMAKTVGMPLALAAIDVLKGRLSRRGVFIPIYKDVYDLILPALEKYGVGFIYTR